MITSSIIHQLIISVIDKTLGCDTLLVVERKKKATKPQMFFYGSKAKQFKKTGLTFTGVNSDNTIALKTIVI